MLEGRNKVSCWCDEDKSKFLTAYPDERIRVHDLPRRRLHVLFVFDGFDDGDLHTFFCCCCSILFVLIKMKYGTTNQSCDWVWRRRLCQVSRARKTTTRRGGGTGSLRVVGCSTCFLLCYMAMTWRRPMSTTQSRITVVLASGESTTETTRNDHFPIMFAFATVLLGLGWFYI